jgi:predicted nucleotidyltransferase
MKTTGKEFNMKVLKEIKQTLVSNFGDEVKDVILFGSRAKGTEHEDSDFDFIVLLNNDYTRQMRSNISKLCWDVALKYETIPQTLVIGVSELETPRGRQTIYKDALREGIYA